MKKRILIVGGGLAGATAAHLLKGCDITVMESAHRAGGLCSDHGGVQWFGPHVFHTSSPDVMRLIIQMGEWAKHRYKPSVQTGPMLRAMPLDAAKDDAFRVYSEKAWGRPFEKLPESIRSRVPKSGEHYHDDTFSGQPIGGYSAMIERALAPCHLMLDTRADAGTCQHFDLTIWTGRIEDYCGVSPQWIGRTFAHHGGEFREMTIHYADDTPQLRTYSCAEINPYYPSPGLVSEFPGNQVMCYPAPDQDRTDIDAAIAAAKKRKVYLVGRLATCQYLDMDDTMIAVEKTITEALG
jgi:UDP-galactopyranose mutase